MTNEQLTQCLTSGDNTQIQQAVTYLEQQKTILSNLLVDAFVAWQLVEDEDIKKNLTKLLKKYAPKDWQLLLKDKYSLRAYQKQDRDKKFAKKLAQMLEIFPITCGPDFYKQWIAYLFPHFPDILWQVFLYEKKFTEEEKKQALQNITAKSLDFSALGVIEITPFIPYFKNIENFTWTNSDLSKIDLSFISNFKQLKALDLNSSNLKKLPPNIDALSQLEELNLNRNPLPCAELSQLVGLKRLKILSIEYCDFEQLPDIFSSFPVLEELYLDDNPLTQVDFSFLAKLPQLKSFSIWKLHFELKKQATIWEQFQQVKVLDLGNLMMTFYDSHTPKYLKFKELPIGISAFTELEELDLKDNLLTHAHFLAFTSLKKLKKLNLENCELNQLPITISELTQLQQLNLFYNKELTHADFSPFRPLKNLKELNLLSCHLEKIPASFSQLHALEFLHLGLNWLTSSDISGLVGLENLKKLNLNLHKLTESQIQEVLNQLATLKNLEELTLVGKFANTDFAALTFLKKLQKLDVSHCELTKLPTAFLELSALEILNLWNNPLTQEDILDVSALKNLKKLIIGGCKLKKAPITATGVKVEK